MIVYLICYLASFLLARGGHFYLSGLCLMGAAIFLYVQDLKRTGNCIHLRGVFALAWVGGQGVSCLKLSRLAQDWTFLTWLCFLAAFVSFYFVFEIFEKRGRDNYNSYASRWKGQKRWHDFRACEEPVFICALAVTAVSLFCFILEAVVLGYVPFFLRGVPQKRWHDFRACEEPVFICALAVTAVSLFCFILEAVVLGYVPFFLRGVPHAYSYFHITGVHYFTVSCVLVPALSVIFFHSNGGRDRLRTGILIGADVIAVLIPILCVSRFQLILAAALAVITYLMMDIHIDPLQMIISAAVLFIGLLTAYIILTIARSHDVEYLNGIFEMKNSRTPIFITQPYMYIANNYDNFDCLVRAMASGCSHSFGLKMLFPLWALTGLKFLIPSLTAFPLFTTKEELTTVTLFYDAYYDFGILGVVLLGCLLGFLAWYLTDMVKHIRNPIGYLLYTVTLFYDAYYDFGILGVVLLGCLLGFLAWYLTDMVKHIRNPIGYLLYAQIAVYFGLSFFTTWFSNPATWFYLVLTGAAAVYVEWRQ